MTTPQDLQQAQAWLDATIRAEGLAVVIGDRRLHLTRNAGPNRAHDQADDIRAGLLPAVAALIARVREEAGR